MFSSLEEARELARERGWPVQFIGHGVYAVFDGYSVWLLTDRENGLHQICLEPAVLKSLNDFYNYSLTLECKQ